MMSLKILGLCLVGAAADGVGFCPGDAPQYSGYLDAGPDEEYFYYLATSRSSSSASDPLVLWMTGGPGCSSILALLVENGPCRVDRRGADGGWTMTPNPWSWSEVANVVWVDQPVGVGFSTQSTSLVQDERQVAERMFSFLQSFYSKYPHFLNVPLFITGESYGGHYVPAVAVRVLHGQGEGVGVLWGITIGNGEVDPTVQWASKPEMAFTGGPGGSLHGGVVNGSTYQQMKRGLRACEAEIRMCQRKPRPASCIQGVVSCASSEIMPIKEAGLNPYDMRKRCDPRLDPTDPATALCYNFTPETQFLNDPAVKRSLGVRPERIWSACSTTAMLPFLISGDYLMSYRDDVTKLLGAGVRVLVYAGDTDFMVDWIGCKSWVQQLPWAHQREWLAAPQEPLFVGNRIGGRSQSAHGLSFIQIYDAGHMVPMDQPELTLAMLRDFIRTQGGELTAPRPAPPSNRSFQLSTVRLKVLANSHDTVSLATMLLIAACTFAALAVCIRTVKSRQREGDYYLMA